MVILGTLCLEIYHLGRKPENQKKRSGKSNLPAFKLRGINLGAKERSIDLDALVPEPLTLK